MHAKLGTLLFRHLDQDERLLEGSLFTLFRGMLLFQVAQSEYFRGQLRSRGVSLVELVGFRQKDGPAILADRHLARLGRSGIMELLGTLHVLRSVKNLQHTTSPLRMCYPTNWHPMAPAFYLITDLVYPFFFFLSNQFSYFLLVKMILIMFWDFLIFL